MNYLAHAYLSFNDPGILTGNLISDFVKGKKQFSYPSPIRKGIILHRHIDDFTDSHEVTKSAKAIFAPYYRLYASPFIDVIYDHFLAADETEFPNGSLLSFSHQTYSLLDDHVPLFPDRFRQMYPYMKQHNWLYNYRHRQGMARSFEGLVNRALYLHESSIAYNLFEKHYDQLRDHYKAFFPSLKKYAFNKMQELLKED